MACPSVTVIRAGVARCRRHSAPSCPRSVLSVIVSVPESRDPAALTAGRVAGENVLLMMTRVAEPLL